ncbi:hypothetical protein D3C80_718250 [compost metagenome]|jgi:hypothetical protein
MLTVIAAAAALFILDVQQPDAAPPPSGVSTRTITASRPVDLDRPTRTVCAWERPMGSTIGRRVCRKVPIMDGQNERLGRDTLRGLQRPRLPDVS